MAHSRRVGEGAGGVAAAATGRRVQPVTLPVRPPMAAVPAVEGQRTPDRTSSIPIRGACQRGRRGAFPSPLIVAGCGVAGVVLCREVLQQLALPLVAMVGEERTGGVGDHAVATAYSRSNLIAATQ